MAEPYNYNIELADPTKTFTSAFQVGANIQESRLKQEQQQQQIAQQKVIQEGFNKLRQPDATAADYANLSMLLPETQAKAVRESFTMLSDERKQASLQQAGKVFSAFKSGNPEIAISLMEQQIAGKRNSGDEEGAKFLETWRDVARENPKATEDYFGFTMSQMPGGDKVISSAIAISQEGRAAAQGPAVLREALAKANKEEEEAKISKAKAITAPEIAKADLLLAQANAKKADIVAKYEEQNQIADLKKKGVDLGLTTAQTNKVFVETRKLGTEAKKAVLELESFRKSGGQDPDKVFQQEEKLRKEYTTRTQKYRELGGTFENIKSSAAAGNGQGDIALITSFMKMLDPGSVVRETEFATGRDTAGLYANLQNTLQKAQNGQFLNATQRKQYVDLSKKYLDSSKVKANEEKASLGKVVKNYSLNPENVFGVEATTPTAPATTTATAPPTAQRNVKVNY